MRKIGAVLWTVASRSSETAVTEQRSIATQETALFSHHRDNLMFDMFTKDPYKTIHSCHERARSLSHLTQFRHLWIE
jgi:hypothetical protein